MKLKKLAKIKNPQWNTRIRPEYLDAIQGVVWKTKCSQQDIAELGIAVLFGLDKKDSVVSRCRAKIMAAAEGIDVVKGLPVEHFLNLIQSEQK